MFEPKIVDKELLAAGKFVQLAKLTYTDDQGKTRFWESVNRTNANGAVMIIARVKPENAIILVRQFRPPAGKYMIEFPAGLVDKGNESLEEVAHRELLEETGYRGKTVKIIPPGYSSPGLSGETIATVVMDIDGTYYQDNPPTPQPEEGESIEVFVVKRDELEPFLQKAIAQGDGVDAKILTFAANI